MTPHRLLVLGASGGTGRALVSQALDAGHVVTAIVRDPSRLSIASERLHVITGEVTTDEALLARAMHDQEVVICALGAGKSFKSNDLIATVIPRLVKAMQNSGVRRLIHTSAFGVGGTYADTPILARIFMKLLLGDITRDKEAGEVAIRASDLDWTVVYPTGLSDRPASGTYRTGEHLPLTGFPTISRADVANFLLKQADDTTFYRKGVLVAS